MKQSSLFLFIIIAITSLLTGCSGKFVFGTDVYTYSLGLDGIKHQKYQIPNNIRHIYPFIMHNQPPACHNYVPAPTKPRSISKVTKPSAKDAQELYKQGLQYFEGKEVKIDYRKAVELFKKAADQNLAIAQNKLGECYFNGLGVEKDTSKAIEYLQKAADNNLTMAQTLLGECYLNGNGVKKDTSKAMEYLHKAADKGDQKAKKLLNVLEKTVKK